MKMQTVKYTVLAATMTIACGCERRPLYDNYGGNLYVEIDTEIEPDVASRGTVPPSLYAVAFYDCTTHELVQTEYLPTNGGYVEIAPGTYDMLTYTFDAEYVQLRGADRFDTLEAFTSEVTGDISNRFSRLAEILARYRAEGARSSESDPLIFQPDPFYTHRWDAIEIPAAIADDDVKHVKVTTTTLLETYTLTIHPVLNGEYVASAEVFVSGMGSARLVAPRLVSAGPATIWFPITLDSAKTAFFTTFKTFGRFPDADTYVYLHVVDMFGNEYDGEWNVTDQVAGGSHDIVIDATITITPEETGGMNPTLTLWGEEISNITI